ncbi:MAG: amidohydrolase [Hyphomicrobiaceae bacterium]
MTTIYSARTILTMNPARPVVSHVAVRDGRILGAGSIDELIGWGPHTIDDRFRDKVLMPGLVEGHSHTSEGSLWQFVYCGYFDRTDPDGRVWPGVKTIDALVERMAEANRQRRRADSALTGWGLDPIYFKDRRVERADLDRVERDRPIGIMHASGHIMSVNTKALEMANMMRSGINHPGVPMGADGLPTGEMKGPEAMTPVGVHVGLDRALLASDEPGLRAFGRLCVRKGVTTATDLASLLPSDAVKMMQRVTREDDFPARIVAMRVFRGVSPTDLVRHAMELRSHTSDRLRLGAIKIVVDGSIQGFSARLRWPGYYNGAPPGLWYVAPEQLREVLDLALQNQIQVHAHTNGDEATELVLDTLASVLSKAPALDHRLTLQHCQLADTALFRRMKLLGVGVNLFPNHHYFWGDQHYALTVGPERAERMNACATALANGVPLAIHSDAPVTPLGPLFTAWCAMHRITASGRTLGRHERISLNDALKTITLGAAYSLKLDHEVGSIECGKRADFTVLDENPLEVDPMALKDIGIWGTVQGGRIFDVSRL